MLFDDIRGPVNRGMDVMKLWNLSNEQVLTTPNDSTASQMSTVVKGLYTLRKQANLQNNENTYTLSTPNIVFLTVMHPSFPRMGLE